MPTYQWIGEKGDETVSRVATVAQRSDLYAQIESDGIENIQLFLVNRLQNVDPDIATRKIYDYETWSEGGPCEWPSPSLTGYGWLEDVHTPPSARFLIAVGFLKCIYDVYVYQSVLFPVDAVMSIVLLCTFLLCFLHMALRNNPLGVAKVISFVTTHLTGVGAFVLMVFPVIAKARNQELAYSEPLSMLFFVGAIGLIAGCSYQQKWARENDEKYSGEVTLLYATNIDTDLPCTKYVGNVIGGVRTGKGTLCLRTGAMLVGEFVGGRFWTGVVYDRDNELTGEVFYEGDYYSNGYEGRTWDVDNDYRVRSIAELEREWDRGRWRAALDRRRDRRRERAERRKARRQALMDFICFWRKR